MSQTFGEPIHVLHVDDEPSFADMVAEFLEREDEQFAIDTVTSASEGTAHLAESTVDCIVSDYDMPGQNGLEFLNTVRDDYPELPFILFTGKGSEEVASEAISAGVTDYLQKESGTEQYTLLANRIKNAVAQYRAERKVEQTERRYRRLIEESTDVITVIDENATFQYLSPATERLLGYAADELVGENAFEYVHPDDRESVLKRFAEQIEHPERRITAEFRFDHAHKDWTWLGVRGRNLLDDAIIGGIVVYARDITERKEREEQLRQSEERYRRLLETSPSPIYISNLDRELIYANEAAVEFLGADSKDGLLGTTTVEFVHPDDQETVENRIQRLVETGDPVAPVEEKLVDSNGNTKAAIVASAPVTYEGEPAMQTVTTDITERKERERDLERKNEQLEEFASVVSHDLRSPLNVAKGHLDLAQEERDGEHLDAIRRSLNRMESLVEDILTVAREGEHVRELESVDLADTVERCWHPIASADASLVTDTERVIRADEGRLQQLLENLVRNAIDHGGDGVTIRVGDLDDGFFIADDGPGIAEDRREKVFKSGYSSADEGTGFGLSIVETIAEAHDWEIGVTESDEGGAQFEITGVESSQ